MPPRFCQESFLFSPGEQVPEHIEEYPFKRGDPDKWHLEGFDQFDGTTYIIAVDIESEDIAWMLFRARQRQLDCHQPPSHSGGQSGLQDRTDVIYPQKH